MPFGIISSFCRGLFTIGLLSSSTMWAFYPHQIHPPLVLLIVSHSSTMWAFCHLCIHPTIWAFCHLCTHPPFMLSSSLQSSTNRISVILMVNKTPPVLLILRFEVPFGLCARVYGFLAILARRWFFFGIHPTSSGVFSHIGYTILWNGL